MADGHLTAEAGRVSLPARRTSAIVAGGSAVEGLGGIGAAVLAIIALAGVLPIYLSAIATIVVGSALFVEGSAVAAGYRELLHRVSGGSTQTMELGGGLTAESLGGLAGVALGILALIGVMPVVLLAVSAIVLGTALLLGAGATERLSDLRLGPQASETTRTVARELVATAAGTQVMIGGAATVLGILAVLGISPVALAAIAMLCLGTSAALTGSALGGKIAAELRR